MSEQKPTEPPGRWLEEVHEQLGDRTATVREALKDVAAVIGASAPTAFWSRRGDENVTVFILASNVLHRLDGGLDPADPEKDTWDGEVSVACEYRMAAITEDATHELRVTSTYGLNQTGGIARHWLFEVGRLGAFEFSFSKNDIARGPDPMPLARALAAEIAAAQSRPGGDA
jgi:hypothetical protein